MATSNEAVLPLVISSQSNYDRVEELKAFDETKAGVKGLVDAGLAKVPRIFIRPPNEVNPMSDIDLTDFRIPVIELQGTHQKIVNEIENASENWGFFQVVNHGVPLSVLEEMIKAVIRFHEQDLDVKKEFFCRDDDTKRVRYNSNFDLYESRAANWRDSLSCVMVNPDPVDPKEIPATCRDIIIEYTKHATTLANVLFELVSEALGLKADHLKQMNCAESCALVSHYYPSCPEPELTLGTASHTDPTYLTVLLQDNIGGLQVLHDGHWIDVNPIPGALVINIGDLLQIASNDKFKSIEHRVLANHVGPRVSVACFLTPRFDMATKPFGPIKELISDESRPVYREISMNEYLAQFFSQGLDEKCMSSFKL